MMFRSVISKMIFSGIYSDLILIPEENQLKIEIENGTATYCEQTFDYTHIFCFEFWDDEFEDLNYFAIDG